MTRYPNTVAAVAVVALLTIGIASIFARPSPESMATANMIQARADFIRACSLRVRLGYDLPEACGTEVQRVAMDQPQ
ncbi:MAG: hypothetical protein HOO99_04125 [Hyphomicrobiaceae bacterium]|nr:hypothetical protein [Hyphomicrobiaceae bacterium]